MQRTPLWEMPGFVACGPDQPMTDEQRALVFGDRFDRFMDHLAGVVTAATQAAAPTADSLSEPLRRDVHPSHFNSTSKQEAETRARVSA